MTTLGALGAIATVIYLLLKLYMSWKKIHERKDKTKDANEFGKMLMEGDDIGVSTRLSDEFDRVQQSKGSKDSSI